jgi:hypothetical protein
MSYSRHGGHWHLDGTQVPSTRNGPYRWKASAVTEVRTIHRVLAELILATLTREDPREGVLVQLESE